MGLYISTPEIIVPDVRAYSGPHASPRAYSLLRTAYGLSGSAPEGKALPRFNDKEFYDASAHCVSSAARACASEIDMLIDCRTGPLLERPSPTYALAAQAGLRKALTWSVGGQSGSEFVQAMDWLSLFDGGYSSAVCVGQKLSPFDESSDDLFDLAEAVGAVTVTAKPPSSGGLQILGVAVRHGHDWEHGAALRLATAEALRQADSRADRVRWVVAQHLSHNFSQQVRDEFPGASLMVRRRDVETNFITADIMVSIADIRQEEFPARELGLALFAGRFGTVGTLALKRL